MSTTQTNFINTATPATLDINTISADENISLIEKSTLSLLSNNGTNETQVGYPPIPRELTFTEDNLVSVITYSILLVVSSIGNLSVFIILFRRRSSSKVNIFIMHLCCADLIVTFIMLPMEIGWHWTVVWKAGDVGCHILMFCRAFGFYLSSFVIIVISVDRYVAVVHPLRLGDAGQRGKIMLAASWLLSAVASTPQSVIFHQETHPVYHWYTQCVTFHFFPSPSHELAYNLFSLSVLYLLPLTVIIISYTLILIKISKKARIGRLKGIEKRVQFAGKSDLRRSGGNKIQKARNRTLKMSIVIVLVFITCWTPYYVISALWWFDKDTASKIDPKIQRGLFIFAVSNSCVNPVVYGMFTTVFQKEFTKCWTKVNSVTKTSRSKRTESMMLSEKPHFHYRKRVYKHNKYNQYYYHNGYPMRVVHNKNNFMINEHY